ncbi:GNAT family N-acetyltransferase [Streptomyces sp. NPDC003456]|uniref:GNAT family N-acetyltransferase n=1 Tax=Streptomyces sp. NPDC003456 TaxID=3364683 RepID=UPI00367C7E6D
MELRPFAPPHASAVAGWPTSAEEVLMWCGRHEFPLSVRTLSGWHEDDDVRPHVLVEGDTPIACGELWFDAEENEVELARLIVAPGMRGEGLGRQLVAGLLARAVEAGYDDVFLRVHPDNDRALGCYLGAGFVPVDPALAESWNAVQPVPYTWLRNARATTPDAPQGLTD